MTTISNSRNLELTPLNPICSENMCQALIRQRQTGTSQMLYDLTTRSNIDNWIIISNDGDVKFWKNKFNDKNVYSTNNPEIYNNVLRTLISDRKSELQSRKKYGLSGIKPCGLVIDGGLLFTNREVILTLTPVFEQHKSLGIHIYISSQVLKHIPSKIRECIDNFDTFKKK